MKSDFIFNGLKNMFYKNKLWCINKGIMKPCCWKTLLTQIILVALYLLNRFVNPSLIQLIILQDEEDSTSSKIPRYAVLGRKGQECSLCGRKFNRIDILKRHVKQVHERRTAQREYVCNTCGEVFHNLAPFRAHGKSAHSRPSTAAKRLQQDDSSHYEPQRSGS